MMKSIYMITPQFLKLDVCWIKADRTNNDWIHNEFTKKNNFTDFGRSFIHIFFIVNLVKINPLGPILASDA